MVRRASSVPHLNNSGASSADSITNSTARGRAPVAGGGAGGMRGKRTTGGGGGNKATTPTQQRQSSGSSSGSRVPRSRSLTNGMRRVSPHKGGNSGGGGGGGSGSGTGGSSRNTPYFLRSRENE